MAELDCAKAPSSAFLAPVCTGLPHRLGSTTGFLTPGHDNPECLSPYLSGPGLQLRWWHLFQVPKKSGYVEAVFRSHRASSPLYSPGKKHNMLVLPSFPAHVFLALAAARPVAARDQSLTVA
jgi:hypothetical protein